MSSGMFEPNPKWESCILCLRADGDKKLLFLWDSHLGPKYRKMPISLFIFSGAIGLLGKTIEILISWVCERKNVSVIRVAILNPLWRQLHVSTLLQSKIYLCDSHFSVVAHVCIKGLITCADAQWLFRFNRKPFTVKWKQAMTCWQYQLGPAVIML